MAGLAATTFTAARGRTSTLRAASLQADAQVKIAREERIQRRLESAYSVWMEYLSQLDEWRRSVKEVAAKDPGPIPEVPQPSEKQKYEALVNLYQSDEVRKLWKVVSDATVAVVRECKSIDQGNISHPGNLQSLLKDLNKAIAKFIDQMRLEIRRGVESLQHVGTHREDGAEPGIPKRSFQNSEG